MRLATLVGMTALIAFVHAPKSGGEVPKWVGGPHYFSSMSGKQLPERPRNPISEADAKRPDRESAFYVAYFDKQGNLLTFEKILKGRVMARSTYHYDGRGKLLRGEITEPDGPTLSYRADSSGRLVRTN